LIKYNKADLRDKKAKDKKDKLGTKRTMQGQNLKFIDKNSNPGQKA